MGATVLQVGDVPPPLAEALSAKYHALVLPPIRAGREAFLAEHAASVRVIVDAAQVPVDAELMAGGKGLFGRVREAMFPSRKAPVQSTTQAGQVRDRKYGGNTKAMATAYGVAPRTVPEPPRAKRRS